jgi:hypothetical protein
VQLPYTVELEEQLNEPVREPHWLPPRVTVKVAEVEKGGVVTVGTVIYAASVPQALDTGSDELATVTMVGEPLLLVSPVIVVEIGACVVSMTYCSLPGCRYMFKVPLVFTAVVPVVQPEVHVPE